jgi:hypothetical protein
MAICRRLRNREIFSVQAANGRQHVPFIPADPRVALSTPTRPCCRSAKNSTSRKCSAGLAWPYKWFGWPVEAVLDRERAYRARRCVCRYGNDWSPSNVMQTPFESQRGNGWPVLLGGSVRIEGSRDWEANELLEGKSIEQKLLSRREGREKRTTGLKREAL